jgi:hypothetical protein
VTARRPLLTALGATTLLGALWFVPNANATAPDAPESTSPAPASANTAGTTATPATGSVTGSAASPSAAPALSLADSGGPDTTPYLLGGTLCLGLGAGFVTYSVRRSRA